MTYEVSKFTLNADNGISYDHRDAFGVRQTQEGTKVWAKSPYREIALPKARYTLSTQAGKEEFFRDLAAAENATTTKIDLAALTEEQKDAFIEGWKSAGGYMDDSDSPAPWCAPWITNDSIEVAGDTPEAWGADWWNQCKDEIEALKENE